MAIDAATGAGPQSPRMMRPAVKRLLHVAVVWLVQAAVCFASAGRLDWLRGWVFQGLHVASLAVMAVITFRTNPEVVAARAEGHADTKRFDKILRLIYAPLVFAVPAVAGLDAVRFGWSSMPFATVYMGAFLYLLAMIPIGWAMAVNPFLETTVRIQTDRGHHPITSGPYQFIRHPMYAGIILSNVAAPLVFGSVWAYGPAAAMVALFIVRAALEDRTFSENSPATRNSRAARLTACSPASGSLAANFNT